MPAKSAKSEKLTRKQAKARTRRKLLDALVELAGENGVAQLSTTKITKRAGVTQSVFYDHFDDMDHALGLAAEEVGQIVRDSMSVERARIEIADPIDALRATYAAGIDGLLAQPMLAELLLRYRRHPGSPLGATLRHLLDDARDEILGDMRRLGLGDRFEHLELRAELFMSMAIATVESLLDGRYDRDACLDVLTEITVAALIQQPD